LAIGLKAGVAFFVGQLDSWNLVLFYLLVIIFGFSLIGFWLC